MSDAPELKPCPFCGGNNLSAKADWMCCPVEYLGQVHCDDCDMVGPLSEFKYDTEEEAKKDAIAAWNTRAAPAVKPGEIERIVWSAMVWARENPGPDEVPEYTDRGNSFAEGECRAAVRRILEALQ